MRGMKPSVALAALGVVSLALWASAFFERTGSEMATAANRLLAAMDEKQVEQASFPFDSAERLNWHFIPRPRKGVSIKEMTSAQRALTFGLLHTGLGASGYLKATTIMSLEQILKDMEQGKGPVRDPELYFVSIFGKPSDNGRWGWRVEGHHLSLNLTLENGKIVAATPAFFGSNPAEVRQGPRQGLRTLADVEDRALRLLQALDDNQRKVAVIAQEAPKDIRAANTPQPPTDAAEGIAFADMNDDQRAGTDPIRFAWMGPGDRNQGHAYRLQGPTFLIEFNNTQNNANHVHSVWRNMLGDFGVPMPTK